MDKVRYLIVGAGVTGLSFANWIRDEDYLICEAQPEVGGCCRTVVQDGFVWDYSGHFFHFENPEIERYLLERMGDQGVRRVAKRSRIYYGGELIDFPFQKNIHQLPREDFLDCLVDLFFREEDPSPADFKAMLYARLGRSIAEKFLIPYNEKLYATDLSRLDPDAMGRFFPHADVSDIIANFRKADNASYNASFTYPEGGAIEYIHALQVEVPEERIALSEPVLAVDLERRVARTPSREIAFDFLVSTAPFPRLLGLCGLPAPPETYSWNKVLVFNLGFDRKGLGGVHWIYFPQPELSFYRVGYYDNIFETPRMSAYVEIGLSPGDDTSVAAVERARRRVLDDLRRCGLIDAHRLVSWHSVVLDPAYVHITGESQRAVQERRAWLATHGVYSAGRYGSWTYCSIEDNIIEARSLAGRFNRPGAL